MNEMIDKPARRLGWFHRARHESEAAAGQVRFFRNYNRVIAVAYAALLLGLMAFFAYQLRVNLRQEIAVIQGQVERHRLFLEFVLRSSADQVETLRMAAGRPGGGETSGQRPCGMPPGQLAEAGLREGPAGFHRDALVDHDAGGNLVGQGSLTGRDNDFYCDLEAALALDGHLGPMVFHLPHAARTRFLSVHGFQMIAPWRPVDEVSQATPADDDPVWQLGQPSANPDRLKFWAPSFFGGLDVGLLVPVAAPVYDRDRFMGVVTIDMSLDYLQRVNGNFGYPLGTVSVVDAQGRVLAHPGLYLDPLAVQAPASFSQLFAPGVLPSVEALTALRDGQAVNLSDWVIIRRGFSAAPWQLVYAVPQAELWHKLLRERGPSMLAVLVGMALLMALTYVITTREFVRPAASLVGHLVAESTFRPQPVPRVPQAWRPWFEAITRAFRQSMELTSLRKELDIAARLQLSILPRHWPTDARYSLWGSTAAAREVGGDFYDHFEMADGRRAIVVADVSGKGISAGLFAMVSKTMLRTVATQRQAAPGDVALHVNSGLCEDNDSSMFVTTFHAHYDPATARLVYVNAGHPLPLLVRADGQCEWLPGTGGTAFGVMEGLSYAERQVQLEPGDTLLMYTDGVTEAENAHGEQFGLSRLRDLFARRPVADARDAAERVLKAVGEFAQDAEQVDDITCMAIQCRQLGVRA